METIHKGQVNHSAAEVYDAFFLPALFVQWTDRVLEAARIRRGQRVLDVACGTGVLTLAAAEKVSRKGSVVGLDVNEGMLAVARRKSADIVWRHGRAENLPFSDNHFDAVISQFGLMFFEDRRRAISKMARVLKPGGRLAIAVWDTLENTPGYAAVTRLLQRLFGDHVADAIRAPYVLGDKQDLWSLMDEVDLAEVDVKTFQGQASFPSLKSWMFTDVKGWTLAGILDDSQFELLLREAENELKPFVAEDGTIAFQAPAHIITAGNT